MDVTRERIGRILELREMLLSFQIGFNLTFGKLKTIKQTTTKNSDTEQTNKQTNKQKTRQSV